MRTSLNLGRLRGIPVRLHAIVLVFAHVLNPLEILLTQCASPFSVPEVRITRIPTRTLLTEWMQASAARTSSTC